MVLHREARHEPVSRGRAVVVLIAALASIAAGALVYGIYAPSNLGIVAVELGGSGQRWPLPAGLDAALWWDLVLIAGYGTGLWLAATAATWVFWSPRSARLARLGRGIVVVAVAADLVENLFLALALRGTPGAQASAWQARFLEAAATASTVKWAALVPAVAVAAVGVLVATGRLLASRRTREKLARPVTGGLLPLGRESLRLPEPIEEAPGEPPIRVPAENGGTAVPAHGQVRTDRPVPGADVAQARWARAYDVPGVDPVALAARKESDEVIGFCLSGGGIRSGSVAMGVLQTMRKELRRARYLISVSGGGYTAGAFAQLLTDAGDADVGAGAPIHDAKHAFAAGSVELDHVRRHSSYIASTASQMLVGLGVLARGLVTSLALVFAPAVALGVAAAWFYHYLPVAVLPLLPHQAGGTLKDAAGVATAAPAGAGLTIPLRAVLAVVLVTGAAVALWLLQLASSTSLSAFWQRACAWASRASVFMTRVAVIVAVVAVAVPVLVWAAGRVVSLADGSVGVGISGSVGTVLLTFLTSLATLLWRKRKTIKDTVSGGGTRTVAVPNGLLQQLLVIVSVGVLTLSWLMLFGATAIATKTDLRNGHAGSSLILAAVITLLVAVVGGTFDESSLSLHPFYRRRLATAFAVRSVSVPAGGGEGASAVAVAYHPRERTALSTYARPARAAGHFPEFVFAAAANLTGEDRTPPGLTAVSFTMGANWVGGPDVGWVETAALERMCPDRLRRDVTVQGAVAISGAAIASAMGRFARWYQIVLALSGARLGAWLPNPVFLGRIRAATDEHGRPLDWTLPGLPSIRRATYLLRELFNVHPHDERLLQVTDGGHYENLGIVEALRRRCTTIYCVDGGGDTPPTAAGLAEAIALAEAELGVRIRLDRPFDAEPGTGRALEPPAPLAALNAALSKQPVITGRFEYPAASGLPEGRRTGVLYVARALLWPEMPYSLLSYAAQHPAFPHDSTGDQWFDDGQFTAYTQLGGELGVQVLRVRKRLAAREAKHLLRPAPRVDGAPPAAPVVAGADVGGGGGDGADGAGTRGAGGAGARGAGGAGARGAGVQSAGVGSDGAVSEPPV